VKATRKETNRNTKMCVCVDNIKMDLEEIGWGGMDQNGLAQGRDKWRAFLNVVVNLRVSQILGNS
jgi:hypothetical protein